MYNWLQYLIMVIKTYFASNGNMIPDDMIFKTEFPGQLWINIENFIKNQ